MFLDIYILQGSVAK